MNLEAFRAERAKNEPLPPIRLEDDVQRIRGIFESVQQHMAALHRIHIPMPLALGYESHDIMFRWLLDIGYAPYKLQSDRTLRHFEAQRNRSLELVIFAPKDAHVEEVMESLRK